MQYTQAQIDRANAVSLEDFLRTQGETLIKSGREYRWKEHDSLTVRGNKWFRHSQSKGGYPIDFVMEFYGKSFPEAVQLLTGESAERAGIQKHVSTHCLRHSFASHLFESGCDIKYIQALLGHRDPKSTEIYLHVSNKTLLGIKSPFDEMGGE